MLTKSKVKEQIALLPDHFTLDELVEKLIFLNKVESGLEDSTNNKIDENELEKLMKKWVA